MKRALFALICVAFASLPTYAACDSCQAVIYPACWYVSSSKCIGEIGTVSVSDGAPGAPVVIGSCICDSCASSGEGTTADPGGDTITCTYSETTGFSFCLTVTGGVEFGGPVTPRWTIEVSGEWCWSSSETQSASVELTCMPGQKRKVTITETTIPTTVSIPITYKLETNYAKRWLAGSDCPTPTNPYYRSCETEIKMAASERKEYSAAFEDLACPDDDDGDETPPLPEDQ